jgi:hypothetical protein
MARSSALVDGHGRSIGRLEQPPTQFTALIFNYPPIRYTARSPRAQVKQIRDFATRERLFFCLNEGRIAIIPRYTGATTVVRIVAAEGRWLRETIATSGSAAIPSHARVA